MNKHRENLTDALLENTKRSLFMLLYWINRYPSGRKMDWCLQPCLKMLQHEQETVEKGKPWGWSCKRIRRLTLPLFVHLYLLETKALSVRECVRAPANDNRNPRKCEVLTMSPWEKEWNRKLCIEDASTDTPIHLMYIHTVSSKFCLSLSFIHIYIGHNILVTWMARNRTMTQIGQTNLTGLEGSTQAQLPKLLHLVREGKTNPGLERWLTG